MKKIKHNFALAVYSIFLFVICFSCKQADSGFSIEGSITGLEDGTKLELKPAATHTDEKALAECIVKDGHFLFKEKLDEPRLFNIQVSSSYSIITVMAENTKIEVNATASISKRGEDTVYNFSDVLVKGSDLHKMYLHKMAFKDSLNDEYEAYFKKYDDVLKRLNNARADKDEAGIASIRNSDEYKAFEKAEHDFFTGVERSTNNAILKNKDSFWGPLIMLQSMNYFTPEQKPLYDAFSQEAKDSYYGKIVYKELFPPRLVDKEVPAFELPDKNGEMHSFSQLKENKKYVLIDFWASWCSPCRKEIPNLKRIYSEFSGKGLQIVSVSIDQKQAPWLKALDQEGMVWPNLWDNNNVDNLFLVKAIPALFLVNEKGIVISDDLRGEALYEELNELLK